MSTSFALCVIYPSVKNAKGVCFNKQECLCWVWPFSRVSVGIEWDDFQPCRLEGKNPIWKPFHYQQPFSTVFWKYRQDLCVWMPHCAQIQINNNANPVWLNGGTVWHAPVFLPSHLILFGGFTPLSLRYFRTVTVSCHHRPYKVEDGSSTDRSQTWKLRL